MDLRKSGTIENIESYIGRDIFNWSYGNDRFLNVVAPPFSSAKIMLEMIYSYVRSEKKVLYITEVNSKVEILEALKDEYGFKKYTLVKEDSNYNQALLVVCSINQVLKVKGYYNLIIFDDSKVTNEISSQWFIDYINNNFNPKAKYIYFGIESIFSNCREIIVPVRENLLPIVEPRFITTRIDLEKEIPFVAFDYLRWSLKEGRNVIIYAPNEEKVLHLFEYLIKLKEDLSRQINFDLKGKNSTKSYNSFYVSKGVIIITDNYNKTYEGLRDVDIMVLFSDDPIFDYKKLVHFCGKVGRGKGAKRAEVIFLSNSVSKDMEIAKNITSSFNKEAWESNLFRY